METAPTSGQPTPEQPISGQSSAAPSARLAFGQYYYAHDCGIPYERSDHWLAFFDTIAERIVEQLQPTTALDAGCAFGMLVEALRKRGVDAYGIDISEFAIEQADPSVRDYLTVQSLTEPIARRFDLVTCIEVVEHLPSADAKVAIGNLAGASDALLLSSSPFDYGEPTHVNVRPPEEWAADLARHDMLQDLDFDASFIAPWTALFRHARVPVADVVLRYERARTRLAQETRALRESVLMLQQRLEEHDPEQAAQLLRAEEDVLRLRDELVAAEARLGEALGRERVLDTELLKHRDAADELVVFQRSSIWRLYSPYRRLRGRAGSAARAVKRKLG